MMHPSKPFTRDHAAVIVNASVFVVDNPAIAAIEISIVLVVFISVLIFTDQFSFFEIISPVIEYQNEFQLRSYHYVHIKHRQEFKGSPRALSPSMLDAPISSKQFFLALNSFLNEEIVLFCSNHLNLRERT